MGFIAELGKVITPHAKRLNENIAYQGAMLHNRLANIERALGNVERLVPDKWYRVRFNQAVTENEQYLLASVPISELWVWESLITDGEHMESPGYIITSGGSLLSSVMKEGNGSENYGGDAVSLPGEDLILHAREDGR